MNNNVKSIFTSRVFWLAIIQAVAGALVIFSTSFPEWAGYLLIAKSVLDVFLREITTTPVAFFPSGASASVKGVFRD